MEEDRLSDRKIWITGASGRIGTELVKALKADMGNKIVATDLDVDITDLEEVNSHIDIYRPNIVINCAAIPRSQYCEEHMVETFKVNALGARNLAIASRRLNAKIIHISTDDVFDGKTAGMLTEFDVPLPVSVYGKSKLAGENYVKELNPKHLIVRSSWVYGSGIDRDFFTQVVRHGQEGTSFDVTVDQVSSPTCIDDLVNFLLALMDKTEYGIYHASSEGACTRLGFASAVLEQMGYDPSLARGVFANGATQTSTLLENLMMKMTGVYEMPQWQDGLRKHVEIIRGRSDS